MPWIIKNLWLIPVLPMLAAGVSALMPRRCRIPSASLAIGSLVISFLLSLCAFSQTLSHHGEEARQVFNFNWFQFGDQWVQLGWVLDPLTAVMLVMVTFVGTLIFIYSVGYMSHDENFTRFFTFLSLFAGAMLGVVIANSLLLLFICWELVGLTSYLLIGFWYHKPAAAAAAKKAFITTRIGDVALLLGMVWLYSRSGTLLFYNQGAGCLEQNSLYALANHRPIFGMAVSTGIGLLIFAGAVGKSGQVPLHVWLPDAMEGPTPVSALIHAATMVAAGVFLVARMYPLMSVGGATVHTLHVITWVGAITAIFAASIAVAQDDIKRILAYSTVSQLGYMMMGLGVGGVAVGMFHLITHAFFKALLFMGAGSVIHGCHEEQDICRMGGLRKFMPVTFLTYAVGMLALCGFPLLFSGFWSKDEILHSAHDWPVSHIPFYLGAAGALLTAFYMTRQVFYVFFGDCRLHLGRTTASERRTVEHAGVSVKEHPHAELSGNPHESPASMTIPLIILAACSILLGFLGTPAWPWFQKFLGAEGEGFNPGIVSLMIASSVIVFIGMGLGWWFYGRNPLEQSVRHDPLLQLRPDIFTLLHHKFYVDEIYEHTIIAFNAWFAHACDWLDFWIWNGAVQLVSYAVIGLSWVNRCCDEFVVNLGFDEGCKGVSSGGKILSRLQNGRVQNYLRVIGIGLTALALLLIWGCRPS
ncbi:MAG TPA: NADH-quinone oxidoreductase subunit L [Verrucomicrobiae bacterium]|jgi:NADH-quinone oxidoreductase subunit L|nr:NADH-quinone oxidoreductase subunit L [Verrucomicrobiae bacterium]